MIYLLIASILWGSSFPVIKHGLNSISPFLFVTIRHLVAFLFLLLLIRDLKPLRHLFQPSLIAMSCLNAAAFALQFKGQELTTAAKSALFINTNPLFIVLLAPLLTHERPTRRQLIALAMAWCGIIITSTRLEFSEFTRINPGDMLSLFASLSWSFLIMYSGQQVRRYGEVTFSLIIYFWTSVLISPLILFEPIRFQWAAWPAVVYLALVTTVLAFYCYSRGIRQAPAIAGSIVFLVEVVVAGLLAYLTLGERFSGIEILGFILVMAGVGLVIKQGK